VQNNVHNHILRELLLDPLDQKVHLIGNIVIHIKARIAFFVPMVIHEVMCHQIASIIYHCCFTWHFIKLRDDGVD
jgi:hypothetical protein